MASRAWGSLTVLLLLALGADATCIAWYGQTGDLRGLWIGAVAIMTALCALAGYLVNGRIDGILIDDRNRISLERVQWTGWLIVLLSGYFCEAILNAALGQGLPVMQPELYALLGIVSASPIASNLITDTKKRTPPAQAANVGPQAQPGQAAAPVALQPLANADQPRQIGVLDVNGTVAEASWADLYLGEEIANRYVVDISRLQKLIITVLLIFVYIGALWHALSGSGPFTGLPPIGQTFIWLLGVSHAAYLASKATPKTSS